MDAPDAPRRPFCVVVVVLIRDIGVLMRREAAVPGVAVTADPRV